MARDVVIGMAGSGGDGIVSAGESLISAAAAVGYHAMMSKSFGPQIRGGESSCRVRVSTHQVHGPGDALDLAVALNWDDFLKFGTELACGPASVVVYDSNTGIAPADIPLKGARPAQVFALPLTELTVAAAGTDKAKNSLILGLLSGWLGIGRDALLAGMRKRLGKKGPELLAANQRAFDAGHTCAMENPLIRGMLLEEPNVKPGSMMLADGNDMTGAGAVFAGVEFFGGYPITPSTEIMQFLGREIWKYGGVVLQAEDEIAGVGAAIGASFAGKKSMTATSGPGMALKTEMLGLATIAEIPLVLVNVQRGGPSTGLPTKTEQSDLFQACFSAHGDVMRPVLAPTSVGDCFRVTIEAFNIAEKYQTPVIVLSDQDIGHRKETIAPIDTSLFKVEQRLAPTEAQLENYARFAQTEDGISPMSKPGTPGGAYLCAGIEHNESGAPAANGAVHARMNDKRFRKFNSLVGRKDLFEVVGNPDAPLALIAWGSLAGVCREAQALAVEEGLHVKLFVPTLLYPINEDAYGEFLASVQAGLVVEQSHQGQLYRILRMQVDVPRGLKSLARDGANPIHSRDIVARLRELSANLHAPSSTTAQGISA